MNFKSITLAVLGLGLGAAMSAQDVQTFTYSTPDGKSGLRMAWRTDSTEQWQPIDRDLVKSDFGVWSSQKKMFNPRLFLNAADSMWTVVFDATPTVTGVARSKNLTNWEPQCYRASVLDIPADMRPSWPMKADSAEIKGKRYAGYVQAMPKAAVDWVIAYDKADRDRYSRFNEKAKDDPGRFAGLAPVSVSIKADPANAKPISDHLIGIFFEDINYGADGGLYAELIQNRDFEYNAADHKGWTPKTAWTGDFEVLTDDPIHVNNPHYARLQVGNTLVNNGYDSIVVAKGDTYRFTVKARAAVPVKLKAELVNAAGKVLAAKTINVKSKDWADYRAAFKPSASSTNACLRLSVDKGSADLDMVSLFPAKTFRGRENGLRPDLAQTLADLKPRFVRFPGGCVAHGQGIDNIYDWKGSIGPLEARKPLFNLWGYHQTRGLGYHEYFQFCEDIGAEPLPVVAAGVPCQNSGVPSHHSHNDLSSMGQQCGIPWEEMPQYVQDVLDLVEYANGDVTTEWGAKRAAAGHPEPFNLKYLGIGNEDLIGEVFVPRFKMIYDAVRAKYPDVTVIGTVGPFWEGADYDAGWQLARELDIPMVDEHYYVAPGWYLYNRDFYDKYPREGTKVYLGEYAAHAPGRPSTIETALSIALYLTDVERNADVVTMTSYAPLLAKNGHTQWRPDLIYFDNEAVYPTVDYEVQKLYGNNSGTTYVPASVAVASDNDKVKARIGSSVVKDEKTGEYIVKLVNMLPVEVRADVDLAHLGITATKAKAEQLAGSPEDKDAKIKKVEITLPHAVLPPYSFTVFRLAPSAD